MGTFPSTISLLALALGSLAYGGILGLVVGAMARGGDPRRTLARKTFHIGVFTGAAPAQLFLGFWGVVVYGTAVALLVLVALRRGERSSLFRALARPADGEDRRRFVLLPLVATAMGGLLAVLLVGEFAVVGYLVCGWGDAAGEPVGQRWGRHCYSPPFGEGSRTLEGSLGVLLAGALGGWAALGLVGQPFLAAVGVGALCGLVGALAEGLSTHGTDNLWVQLLPALTAWWMLG
ncbi:hypothetical protein ACFL5A_01065 [Gemmatimonadota bacterium]